MREPIEEKELSPGNLLTVLPASAGGNGHHPPGKGAVQVAGNGGERSSGNLLPEPKLLEAAKRCCMGLDNEDDMRVVHDAYYGPLHGYFRNRRVPEEERSDLVNVTFLRFWEYRTAIRSPERIHGFIYGIAKNVFLKWCRKERRSPEGRRRHYPEDDEVLAYLISDVPWPLQSMQRDQGPERKMLAEERKKRLMRALRMLPPKTGLVTRLRLMDGLRNKEIAEKLRMTPNNVGVLLNDAKRRLKIILKDDDPT